MTTTVWGLSLSSVLFAGVVVLTAAFFQSATGFGFALLAVPMLSLVIPPQTAVVVVFLEGAGSSLLTATHRRGDVDRTEATRLSVGAVVAMPLGALILVTASAGALRFALGIVTCSAALVMLLSGARRHAVLEVRPWATYAVGAVSGVLNTALATNGPPLVVYLRARGLGVAAFRGTLSVVFIVSSVVGLGILLETGAVHAPAVHYAVLTLVPALVGWALGNAVADRLRHHQFVRLVDLVLLTSGLLAVTKALLG
jgi:uncharacterized membrane protein YfcA